MRQLGYRIAAVACMVSAATAVYGQSRVAGDRIAQQPRTAGRTENDRAVGIISGGTEGTYIRIAADLANVLDSEDLRILPIVGRGSLQNLRDVMYLRGVDIGIVQVDAREGLKGANLHEEALKRLRYIARLYNEEVHLLASRDITDIRQLDGRKVNIDRDGSGTNLTSRIIFDRIGIKPDFTTYDQASSYERLRAGEIQAAIYIAGRPVRGISEFQSEGRFHLLAIPFEGKLAETYLPSRFAASDYPRLIDPAQEVPTLAVGSALVVFNWPERSERYRRAERFVDAFFSRFEELLKPGAWHEVNASLFAELRGWQRFKPAQDAIERSSGNRTATVEEEEFQHFLDSSGRSLSTAERERLFQEFLSWQRARPKSVSRVRR
jgi:TRAP transporter TAXI family solute receptor